MTVQEFSVEFDILFNNISSNQAPGLNSYEKSVLLTQAEEEVVRGIYNGQTNAGTFESTEEMSDYLNVLVKQVTYTANSSGELIRVLDPSDPIEGVEGEAIEKPKYKFNDKSKLCEIPDDLWFIVYESADLGTSPCTKGVLVKPITHDTYHSISRNPFRGSNTRRVLRVLNSNNIELISKEDITSYTIRYLRKPKPIILEDLSVYDYLNEELEENETSNVESLEPKLKIGGEWKLTECELPTSLHRVILAKAVQLAKVLYTGGNAG